MKLALGATWAMTGTGCVAALDPECSDVYCVLYGPLTHDCQSDAVAKHGCRRRANSLCLASVCSLV